MHLTINLVQPNIPRYADTPHSIAPTSPSPAYNSRMGAGGPWRGPPAPGPEKPHCEPGGTSCLDSWQNSLPTQHPRFRPRNPRAAWAPGAWRGECAAAVGAKAALGGGPGTTLVSEEVKFDSSVMNTQPANF